MNIVTGYRGEPHITAQQIRNQNKLIFADYDVDGNSMYYKQIYCAIRGSGTKVTVGKGMMCLQGMMVEVPTAEEITLSPGSISATRTDFIVVRYTKAADGVESAELLAVQSSSYTDNEIGEDAIVDFIIAKATFDHSATITNLVSYTERYTIPQKLALLRDDVDKRVPSVVTTSLAAEYTVAANGRTNLTADDFNRDYYAETIVELERDGYEIIGLAGYTTGSQYAFPLTINLFARGNSQMMAIKNVNNSQVTGTASITFVLARWIQPA